MWTQGGAGVTRSQWLPISAEGTPETCPGRIAARAEYGEAGMGWEEQYCDLLGFLLSPLPFLVLSPAHLPRGSPWGSASQGAGQRRDGQKCFFCFGRSGVGDFAPMKVTLLVFSFLWGLLALWKTLNSQAGTGFLDCLECLFSLPWGLFQWPHLN